MIQETTLSNYRNAKFQIKKSFHPITDALSMSEENCVMSLQLMITTFLGMPLVNSFLIYLMLDFVIQLYLVSTILLEIDSFQQ